MSILSEIVVHKKIEVEKLKQTKPLLHSQTQPKNPNFLHFPHFSLIAEIKPKSPSAGEIRADFDPTKLAIEFENQGANAISVLTDQTYFGGSVELFGEVRNSTKLPLLRKDFIINPYQVLETVKMQADLMLLIVKILEKEQFAQLLKLALELNLQVLVEVFDRVELDLALFEIKKLNFAQNQIIFGVNNRNLETFETKLENCVNLAKFIPADFPKLALSGIKNTEDLEIIKNASYNGVLIGEGLVKNPELFNFNFFQ
jgi:indole-3-glycerol phosphate synthase